MKIAFKTLLIVFFTSALTANGALVASFDIGRSDGLVYNGYGPYAGASAEFTVVKTGNNPATANGITFETYDATDYVTSLTPTDASDPRALFGDYAVQEGPTAGGDDQGNFKITGLDPDLAYDIYIIAPNGTGFAPDNVYGGDYTVTKGEADSMTVTATGGIAGAFTAWIEGRDYAVFSNASSDGTGEFSGTFNRITSQLHTGIAGIQVVQVAAVPEPTTMGFIGIFGGVMLLVRRNINR